MHATEDVHGNCVVVHGIVSDVAAEKKKPCCPDFLVTRIAHGDVKPPMRAPSKRTGAQANARGMHFVSAGILSEPKDALNNSLNKP